MGKPGSENSIASTAVEAIYVADYSYKQNMFLNKASKILIPNRISTTW